VDALEPVRRFDASQGPRIIGPRDGKTIDLGVVGVRFLIWNAGDGLCRILEIISPAGFEHSFDELAAGVGSPEEYEARYGTAVDLDGTRRVRERHGLRSPLNGDIPDPG
jgi:hypothetical protein